MRDVAPAVPAMPRKAYPGDLTDVEWTVVAPMATRLAA